MCSLEKSILLDLGAPLPYRIALVEFVVLSCVQQK